MRRHEKRPCQAVNVKRLMILLPVLNEAEGLEAVLRTIPVESIEERGWTSDIVIVDGNSTDLSREIGLAAGCDVLVQPNHGKGEAVRFGFNYAIKNKYDALVMFDAAEPFFCLCSAAGP